MEADPMDDTSARLDRLGLATAAVGSLVDPERFDDNGLGTTTMSETTDLPSIEARAPRAALPTPALDAARAAIHRRRPDLLNIAALVFFVLAILAASYPAFRAGPRDGPAILLLVGLAGVAFLGIFAFATSEPRTPPVDEGLHALVDALAEPAAVTTADGRLVSFNAAWRAPARLSSVGTRPIPPPSPGSATTSCWCG
jgi:hypothetical protein